ncbi:DUF1573 domain-containing protein [Runella sp. MFBS21]|uniref:DUF1573 domain-containing protein n=1 Tax=Runella sp. MFBS21 TaxID=3034018 RepID=UPI0023F64ED3|nr:DUF1573 domain-containing protein [Runella sp. MFBS21]MDF7817590.1 DUF1573 domain-containing protein [Runella sp. MFBS21]
MKKVTILSVLFTFLAVSLVLAHVLAPAFGWAETEHDFGKIKQGKPVTAEFKFTNKGAHPLIINKAYGSCGCTGVEYPKEPIMPGASGNIKATFNAASVGAFNKTVTVESNSESGIVTLNIHGEVVL